MTDAPAVQLHFLRHADAQDPDGWRGPDDERPLTDKGEKQAERLGRFLASVGFSPDALISSPMVRAVRTAEIVAGSISAEIRTDDRLGGRLDLVALEAILFDAGEPVRPVFVGHDPDFSEIVSALVGGAMAMRKGAFARVDAARPLRPAAGTLRWLIPPDLLESR